MAVIAALAYAAFRRLVTRPRRLTLSAEGLFILLLIFGLMVTDLVADAGRIVLAPAPDRSLAVRGRAPSRALWRACPRARSPRSTTRRGGSTRAPAGLPRLAAVLEAPARARRAVQRVLRPARRRRASSARSISRTARPSASGQITDFTWKDLFDLYNCTECGRCTSRCPANMSGKELDPKLLILNLQDYLLERARPGRRAGTGRRRRTAAATASAHGRRRHQGQRALGVHHVPLVRGRVPGVHRARAEDRRHAPLARPHRVALPGRAAAHVPQPREQRQPVPDVVADAGRLGRRTSASG